MKSVFFLVVSLVALSVGAEPSTTCRFPDAHISMVKTYLQEGYFDRDNVAAKAFEGLKNGTLCSQLEDTDEAYILTEVLPSLSEIEGRAADGGRAMLIRVFPKVQ